MIEILSQQWTLLTLCTIKSAKTYNYKAWFSHAAVTACDTTPTYEDITAPAQETSQVFTAGMPAKSNSVNFAGMPAVKTEILLGCCRRLLFSHRNGIAERTGSYVGVNVAGSSAANENQA